MIDVMLYVLMYVSVCERIDKILNVPLIGLRYKTQ